MNNEYPKLFIVAAKLQTHCLCISCPDFGLNSLIYLPVVAVIILRIKQIYRL